MSFRSWNLLLLRLVGALLILLGIVHLAATSHIPDLLRSASPSVYAWAIGPTLLNHVLVGILLLPLGYTTWLAAGASKQLWARRLLVANTIVVLTFPVCLLVFMRQPEYYRAPLFLASVGIVALVALLMVVGTVMLFADSATPEHARAEGKR